MDRERTGCTSTRAQQRGMCSILDGGFWDFKGPPFASLASYRWIYQTLLLAILETREKLKRHHREKKKNRKNRAKKKVTRNPAHDPAEGGPGTWPPAATCESCGRSSLLRAAHCTIASMIASPR